LSNAAVLNAMGFIRMPPGDAVGLQSVLELVAAVLATYPGQGGGSIRALNHAMRKASTIRLACM
jgi:hypothetical protein